VRQRSDLLGGSMRRVQPDVVPQRLLRRHRMRNVGPDGQQLRHERRRLRGLCWWPGVHDGRRRVLVSPVGEHVVLGGGAQSSATKDVKFATASHYACAGQAVVAADFNGDGVMDDAAGGGDGSACVLFGRGDGTFLDWFEVHAPTWPLPGPISALANVREFDANADGIPDLFVGTSGQVYLYLSRTNRT
jgi:hypothetical protein